MKKYLISIVFATLYLFAKAQNHNTFKSRYNPAFAGEQTNIFGSVESWYPSLEDSPVESWAGGEIDLKELKIGVACLYNRLKLGPETHNFFKIQYSYTVQFNKKAGLTFGSQFSYCTFSLDGSRFNNGASDKLNIRSNDYNYGLGFSFSYSKFDIALSANDVQKTNWIEPNYHIFSSYTIPINNLTIKPFIYGTTSKYYNDSYVGCEFSYKDFVNISFQGNKSLFHSQIGITLFKKLELMYYRRDDIKPHQLIHTYWSGIALNYDF